MTNFAVTGSFASGKSFVLSLIKSMGYKTFSCDDYVRFLYEDKEIQEKVVEIISPLKVFDKKLLAEIIFYDKNYRRKLENFIFPLILEGINNFKKDHKQEKLLFFEVPLLFESGYDKYFDYSICVFCKEEVRLERSKNKGNFDQEIYDKLKSIQLSQDEKVRRANFVIDSDNSKEEIEDRIRQIIKEVH